MKSYKKPEIKYVLPLNTEECIAASHGNGVRVTVTFDGNDSPSYDKHVPESGLAKLIDELKRLFGGKEE